MRKLAPARVSYRNDFLISYRAYMTSGSFHISLFEGTLHVEIHTLRMRYPFQSTGRPISHLDPSPQALGSRMKVWVGSKSMRCEAQIARFWLLRCRVSQSLRAHSQTSKHWGRE